MPSKHRTQAPARRGPVAVRVSKSRVYRALEQQTARGMRAHDLTFPVKDDAASQTLSVVNVTCLLLLNPMGLFQNGRRIFDMSKTAHGSPKRPNPST